MVELTGCGPNDGNIDNSYGGLRITGENTGAPQRVWHARYQNVPLIEEGAAELDGLCMRKETGRPITVRTTSDIGKLNQPNVTFWVLVFAFNPIPVDEHPAFSDEALYRGKRPAKR
jgi:hypothetical protein